LYFVPQKDLGVCRTEKLSVSFVNYLCILIRQLIVLDSFLKYKIIIRKEKKEKRFILIMQIFSDYQLPIFACFYCFCHAILLGS
jgi:hypothetical protein